MDPSTNSTMNGAQHANNPSYSFLDGITQFADTNTLQNGDDFSSFFDPALFESTTLGPGFSQQPQSIPQNSFTQNVPRQSNSPGLPQYNSTQPSFSHTQYPQPIYNAQSLSQPNYDARYFSRPSASPVSFDAYSYQPSIGYPNQTFNPQQMNMPPRQTSTPTNYPPRQQQPSPYVNIGQHPSQLSQVQSADMMHYGTFQDQNQPASNSYVDPALLSANQIMNTASGSTDFSSQQQFLQSPYFHKSGTNLDPMTLQGSHNLQQMPPSAIPQATLPGPTAQIKSEFAKKFMMPKDPHVPKKTKAAKKAASAALKSDGHASDPDTDSDSSDDELTIEEEAPEMTPAVLTVAAPTDERGKAIYDAVSAVWSPRNKSAPAEKIRSGIAGFGDTVRGLRDSWKLKNDNLRKAELPNSPTAGEASRLKEEAARYRTAMEIVMARSLTFGHPAVIKRLGENQFTMSALYSFMLDRFNAGDYDSSLVSNILKFVVKFETLDMEMLEMTKLSKILQRFAKKATNESKTLAQTVLDNAVTASAKKKADAISGKVASPGAVDSPGTAARRELAAGTKRTREGEIAAQPATKKVARVASKPLAVQNAERRKALEASLAAKDGNKATAAATAASAGTASKGKVAVAAPPKSAVFSSLVSASKKPGTSLAARAAAAAKDKTTPGPSTASTSQMKDSAKKDSPPRNANTSITVPLAKTGASSFLGLLADIEKKPEKTVKKDNDIPNETEEQRAKRLRKEARRKLRVSWKADADLVETRLFTHDPSEEIGHNDSQMRDAGDTGREGEMLKLHKGMDDIDDEEEDDDSFDDLEPFAPASEVDFSVLADDDPEASPSTINGVKFGGAMKPESASSESQNKHELDTVMAIYATKADRPSTPKEPDEEEGEFEPAEPETPFGDPNEKVRSREKEYLNRQARLRPSNGIFPPKKDFALQIQAGEIPTELQRALKMFGQQNQPTPPPAAAATGAGLPNEALLLASVQQIRQQLTGQAPQTQYQPPVQNPGALGNIDLAALLASMKQQQPPAQLQPQPPVLPLGLSGNPPPFTATPDDASRKHARTDSNEYDEAGRKGGSKKKKSGFVAEPTRPYNYKTLVCTFWEQGKCLKGDNCTYLHGDDSLYNTSTSV